MRYKNICHDSGSIKFVFIIISLFCIGGYFGYLNYAQKKDKIQISGTQQFSKDEYESKNQNFRIEKEIIIFLDENGNEIKTLPILKTVPGKSYSKAYFSENNKYIALDNVEYEIVDGYQQDKIAEITVLNWKGEDLWKKEHPFYYFDSLSPNGKYFLAKSSSQGSISIFNEKRVIDFTPKNKKGGINFTTKEDWRGWISAFSKNGNFFAVVLGIIKKDGDEQKEIDNLFVLDENGNELWRKEEVISGELYGLNISDNDIITVLGSDPNEYRRSKEYRFDKQGNQL